MGKKRKRSANDPEVTGSAVHPYSFDESALSALTSKIGDGLLSTVVSKQNRQDRKPVRNESSWKAIDRVKASNIPAKHRISVKGSKTQGAYEEQSGQISRITVGRVGADEGEIEDEQSILLQEILALGGTEDDMDLIMGVASDDENDIDETSIIDPKLAKELSNYLSGLGIETRGIGVPDAPRPGEDTEHDLEENHHVTASGHVKSVRSPKSSDTQETSGLVKRPKDLMFEARPDWHAALLPKLPDFDVSDEAPPSDLIFELKKHARDLLDIDNNIYSSKNLSSTSSHRFLSTIMTSGTLSDKVSALTLVVQESPVHTVKSLESLLALAKKRSRGQAVTALGAIKDLLGDGAVLPPDRRLRNFESQPGLLGTLKTDINRKWRLGDALPGSITNAHMIAWAYEDWLKETYFEVLRILEAWCNDEVIYARSRAITYVYELLREKPEQESNLLRLLVNKLGDPDKKIASRASYLILQLQITHPLMKLIISRAIESELLLRPGQSSHAKYYAITTLNQTILSAREEDIARKLLSIYFDLFVTLLRKPDPQGPVTGLAINRKGQIQGGGGQAGKKAKAKAKKEDTLKQTSEETAEKMISAVLTGVNRAFPFAKSDDFTLEQHMDMLFKITHSSNFNTSIQALMLIQQLSSSRHLSEDRFYRTLYESLLDPRLISSSKHALYLNLLFRALKADLNVKRIKAFAKRLVQVITLHQPPFICGVLYLLRELEGSFPSLSLLFTNPEEPDEADEEAFVDAPEDHVASSVSHHTQTERDDGSAVRVKVSGYDGRKRDPEYSNADHSSLWELIPFLAHFHPSVSLFASRLLSGKEMPPKPDLTSHTLIHFLDRFVYRNAKSSASSLRGSSIMQPLAGGEGQDVLISKTSIYRHRQPVNSESFLRKKANDVDVDEVFFHKYFNHVAKGKKSNAQNSKLLGDTDGTDSDGAYGENEDEIWQALIESRPDVEGHSEDGNDLDLDLNDSEDNSSLGGGGVDLGFDDEEDTSDDLDLESEISQEADINMSSNSGSDGSSGMGKLFKDELNKKSHPRITVEDVEEGKTKRRKLKNLPLFASTEDYAEMMQDDEGAD